LGLSHLFATVPAWVLKPDKTRKTIHLLVTF
jgi:hypothetical protein